MHTLTLLIVVGVTITAAYDQTTDVIMISGKLTDTETEFLRYVDCIRQISLSSDYTLLELETSNEADVTKISSILEEFGYSFLLEKNIEAISETFAGEYDKLNAIYDSVPFHLDRIDQFDLPLDGQYLPPGTGTGVHIYVLDSGVNINHEEFEGRAEHNFSPEGSGVEPCSFHGSWVAGIAGGRTVGVAQDAIIHDIKIGSDLQNCALWLSNILSALMWVVENGEYPMVVSTSWSISGGSSCVDQLVNDLTNLGAVFITSAGNDASNTESCSSSPSRALGSLSIASSSQTDRRSSFTNYGSCIDYFAPGENIMGADWESNDALVSASGTSASAPVVSGVAAIIFQSEGFDSGTDVKLKIEELSAKGVISKPTGSPNKLVNFENSEASLLQYTGMILAINVILLY